MSQKYKKSKRCYLIDHHSPQPPTVHLNRLNIEEYEEFIDTAQIDSLMVYCKDPEIIKVNHRRWEMNFKEIKGEGYEPIYTRTDFTDALQILQNI